MLVVCSSTSFAQVKDTLSNQSAVAEGIPKLSPTDAGLSAEPFEQVSTLVRNAIESKKLPGAVLLIGYRGAIIHHEAYGHRQLLPTPLAMEKDTVFDLASLTKPIATATAVMMLADRGLIELDKPVATYLPEFASNQKESITVLQLLTHVGGLIPDNSMSDYAGSQQEIRDRLFALKLNYVPGQAFRYSDVGFQILGELVAKQSGKSLDSFVASEIFGPLGMHETGYLPIESLRARAATTQQRDGHWMIGEVHDPRAYAMNGVAGHAGLFSTARDLAIYANVMLNHQSQQRDQLFSSATFSRMVADYPVPGGIRGLGWDKSTGYSTNRGKSMSKQAFGHGGFTGTAIWIDPELDLYVIFLSNRVHPDGKGNVNPLIGEIGTIVADAVRAKQ